MAVREVREETGNVWVEMFALMQDKLSFKTFLPHLMYTSQYTELCFCHLFPSFIVCIAKNKERGRKAKLSDTHLDQLEGEAFMEDAIDPGTAR